MTDELKQMAKEHADRCWANVPPMDPQKWYERGYQHCLDHLYPEVLKAIMTGPLSEIEKRIKEVFGK